MREVDGNGDVKAIVISGGEPFLERPILKTSLDTVAEAGLRTVVLTNAYWADGETSARDILSSLHPIDILAISADIFHEEFIPLKNLRFAAEAALSLGTAIWLQTLDFEREIFMSRLHRALGSRIMSCSNITVTSLLDVGRAQDNHLVRRNNSPHRPVWGPCFQVNSPLIGPDGSVYACCGEKTYLRGHLSGLYLGNIKKKKFSELCDYSRRNPVFQALRVLGPHYLGDIARESGYDMVGCAADDSCDLCLLLHSDQDLLIRIRDELGRPEHLRTIRLAGELFDALDEQDRQSGTTR